MKKRGTVFLLLMVSLLVLAGWGQKKVELLSDKKLIDLSAAIGNCTLGAEELIPEDGKDTPNPSATPVPMTSVTPKPTAAPTLTSMPAPTIHPKPTLPPKPRTRDISVRDQIVTYKAVSWPDLDVFMEQLRQDQDEWTTFHLVDDYAEAHVYRRIKKMLEELKTELGLKYTEE